MLEINKIHCTDASEGIKKLANKSVDCIVTSPPYYNLRDYNSKHQIGNEPTIEQYIKRLVNVFVASIPKLKPTATIFVNIGEKYNGSGMGQKGEYSCVKQIHQSDIEKGSQMAVPERFKIAMIDNGFICKNTIIWHKPNAMPGGAGDRKKFTNDFEYLFFFVINKDYYFEPQSEPLAEGTLKRSQSSYNSDKSGNYQGFSKHKQKAYSEKVINGEIDSRNKRTVWSIATRPFHDAHFAVFPEKLIETPILSGCPANGLVLDPFMGSGTTAVVARKLNRNFIGFDLNKDYINIANNRLKDSNLGEISEIKNKYSDRENDRVQLYQYVYNWLKNKYENVDLLKQLFLFEELNKEIKKRYEQLFEGIKNSENYLKKIDKNKNPRNYKKELDFIEKSKLKINQINNNDYSNIDLDSILWSLNNLYDIENKTNGSKSLQLTELQLMYKNTNNRLNDNGLSGLKDFNSPRNVYVSNHFWNNKLFQELLKESIQNFKKTVNLKNANANDLHDAWRKYKFDLKKSKVFQNRILSNLDNDSTALLYSELTSPKGSQYFEEIISETIYDLIKNKDVELQRTELQLMYKIKISDFSIKQTLKQLNNMDKNKALEIVANAKIKPDTQINKVYIELQSIIKTKSNNFAEISLLSSEKFDMEPILEEEQLDKQLYLSKFGSFERSEIDVLKTLAINLESEKDGEGAEEVKKEDKSKFKFKIKIAKAKLALAKAKMKQSTN